MLDEMTQELIAIGASITANCQPCLDYHAARARELGAATEDMLTAVAVGKQVRKGAAAKMDRHAARQVADESIAEPAPGCDCGTREGAPAGRHGIPADIESPALLLQGNPRQVVGANQAAQDLFGKHLQQIEGCRGGQVFDCLHSFSAAGCGLDENCEACTIKAAIVDTLATGAPHKSVTATLPVLRNGVSGHRILQVATDRAGDLALVRIEQYAETDMSAPVNFTSHPQE